MSLSAELDLDVLPVLCGAAEVVDAGIVSTLQGQNERDNAAMVSSAAVAAAAGGGTGGNVGRSARFRLLFDPQVCFRGWFWRVGLRAAVVFPPRRLLLLRALFDYPLLHSYGC